jgi:competence protein ComEC
MQQIYVRTNTVWSLLDSAKQEDGLVPVDSVVSQNSMLAWEGASSRHGNISESSVVKSQSLNIGTQVLLSDRQYYSENNLIRRIKLLIEEFNDSIDVWKAVLSDGRLVFRSMISSAFKQVFDPSISEVVVGLLLGREGQVRGSSYHLFKVTGTSHLLAISGFHLSLFIMSISKLYNNLFSKYTLIFVNVAISVLFLYLVGFSPGIFRAFLMFFISSSSIYFNRQKSILISLLFAMIVSLLVDISMLSSVSFQLSYAATFGIITLSSLFKRIKLASTLYFDVVPRVFAGVFTYFVDSFILSTVAQISVFPLVAYHFNEFSIVSVLASSMISWMIPIIIQLSLVLVIIYFLFSFNFFLIFTIPLFFFVSALVRTLQTLAFDWSIVEISTFSIEKVLMCYLIIILIYSLIFVIQCIKNKRNHEKIYNFYF